MWIGRVVPSFLSSGLTRARGGGKLYSNRRVQGRGAAAAQVAVTRGAGCGLDPPETAGGPDLRPYSVARQRETPAANADSAFFR